MYQWERKDGSAVRSPSIVPEIIAGREYFWHSP
jgi:hypothetical protein